MELSRDTKENLSIFNEIVDYEGKDLQEPSHFPRTGTFSRNIKERLHYILQFDKKYQDGKILGAMSTPPHPFAQEIYNLFIEKNLGDRGLNPGTSSLEAEVVHIIGHLLGGKNISGNITSGGTESNLIAMYLAKSRKKHVNHPNIIIPESAHYSFDKAAALMGIQLKKVELNPKFEVDINQIPSLIDHDTIGLVGVVGTSSLGVVDPIPKLSDIAKQYDLHFHVDAAFGGLVLPFLEQLGVYKGSVYDFRNDFIDTITVDPHKMGLAVNPTGMILLNSQNFKEISRLKFKIPYLSGGRAKSLNILGTRPGAATISYWALIQHLGKEGFISIIKNCWENTQFFVSQIAKLKNIEICREPVMNIVGIRPKLASNISLKKLSSDLRQNGWALGYFKNQHLLRVVIMPHVTKFHIKQFISYLKALV